MKPLSRVLLASLFALLSMRLGAEEIRIAVASNFSGVMREIIEVFESESGHQVVLSSGATGKHYAQIINGAPFDAFFAADSKRPRLLDTQGIAVKDSRFTYAIGQLALWSPKPDAVDAEAKVLEAGDFAYLAVANPKLAPYGLAAKQVLEQLGLWKILRGQMVRGENIGQAFQFVKSGNAELGFVAYSQIKHPGQEISGSYWLPPASAYSSIDQQAVLLKESEAARQFLAFFKQDKIKQLIRDYGYAAP